MHASPQQLPKTYRTIFVSDLHLGSRPAQAEAFMAFLKATECETLYLVGDMVDGWRLKRVWYWPQAHNDVVQKILKKARKGTQVIYLPGNHLVST
jgi:UDP-2,3-diacylglucosamine pyrophosphatase LpxH